MSRLTEESIDSIEAKAQDVLLSAYAGQAIDEILPPIDILRVAKELGLQIQEGEFNDQQVSGQYSRKDKTIWIARSDIPARKLFTVAHEFGHHILHESKKDTEVFYRSNMLQLDQEKKQEETEANWFAASLLMPRSTFIRVWKNQGGDFERVADLFRVSPSAAFYRAKSLGLAE